MTVSDELSADDVSVTETYDVTPEQREWVLTELETRLRAEAAEVDRRVEEPWSRIRRALVLCRRHCDQMAVRQIELILRGQA